MHLESLFSRESRSSQLWWFIFFIAMLAIILGIIGLYRYESEHSATVDFGNILYHTLQMFILHTPYFEGSVNWAMEIARWFAASASLLAVWATLARVFREELRLLRLFRIKKHTIICGLGKFGLQLALEFKRSGDHRIVVIENRGHSDSISKVCEKGITVIVGDARSEKVLKRARYKKAKRIFAVCSDENTNLAIVQKLSELFRDHPDGYESHKEGNSNEEPDKQNKVDSNELTQSNHLSKAVVECWLFIHDPKLRSEIKCRNVFNDKESRLKVNVRGLDITEVSARLAFDPYHLDHQAILPGSPKEVHLVILGFGQMGESLALQAVKIGHFANEKLINITIIDQEAEKRGNDFLRRYPAITEFCNFNMNTWSHDGRQFWDELTKICKPEEINQKILTFVVCYEDHKINDEVQLANDSFNLVVAMHLAEKANTPDAQVLVYLNSKHGIASLLPDNKESSCTSVPLYAFGMLEDIVFRKTLLHEEQDILARFHHEYYYQQQKDEYKKSGKHFPDPEKRAHTKWETLEEDLKDSNRQAADHIPLKVRALGCRIMDIRKDMDKITQFKGEDIEMLAKIEHQRWCADKRLDGWRYGEPRDDDNKIHSTLVSWSDLKPEDKRIDEELVKSIIACLEKVGEGIYRS